MSYRSSTSDVAVSLSENTKSPSDRESDGLFSFGGISTGPRSSVDRAPVS